MNTADEQNKEMRAACQSESMITVYNLASPYLAEIDLQLNQRQNLGAAFSFVVFKSILAKTAPPIQKHWKFDSWQLGG